MTNKLYADGKTEEQMTIDGGARVEALRELLAAAEGLISAMEAPRVFAIYEVEPQHEALKSAIRRYREGKERP